MSAAIGVLGILDDIAILADDVAMSTKVAGVSTAGILGDDVAVNAGQATGFSRKRELIVVWEIFKGSMKNKAMILPVAFVLSAWAAWVIPFILIAGGFYLLYEGAEKILEYVHLKMGKNVHHAQQLKQSTSDTILDIEKAKIKSAIFTDFILSIEIIVIALGTVMDKSITVQIISTSIIAFAATIAVYGLVALIIRMDDLGFWLIEKKRETIGNFFVQSMPVVIRALTVIGTLAMILVGGGIMTHNIDMLHHVHLVNSEILHNFIIGSIIGVFTLLVVEAYEFITKFFKK